MKQTRKHTRVKTLFRSDGHVSITLPKWAWDKVLEAKKGDSVDLDFRGNRLIVTKAKKKVKK
jgi:antitoxin component of MazEF toxin-antitoxin module